MTIEQAWDAVLAVQDDIARIVSQAVRAGRVRQDYTTNDGISYCVELLVSTQEVRLDAGRYVLASLRRELHYDAKAVTDALDRGTVELEGEETAKYAATALPAVPANPTEFTASNCLTALENRVARLLAAGNSIGQVARNVGTTVRGAKTVAGMAAAKIRRMEKRESGGE